MGWKTSSRPIRLTKTRLRAVRHDNCHHRIARLEHVSTRQGAKFRNDRSIGHPDASIDLQCAEAKIEQHRLAIALSQRVAIRPEFCQHKTLRHRAV